MTQPDRLSVEDVEAEIAYGKAYRHPKEILQQLASAMRENEKLKKEISEWETAKVLWEVDKHLIHGMYQSHLSNKESVDGN